MKYPKASSPERRNIVAIADIVRKKLAAFTAEKALGPSTCLGRRQITALAGCGVRKARAFGVDPNGMGRRKVRPPRNVYKHYWTGEAMDADAAAYCRSEEERRRAAVRSMCPASL